MDQILFSNTSNIIRFKLTQSASGASPGDGLTGLTSASAGLIIATICDNEATTTRYRASSSEVETIATLGTFAAPSGGKCRFKQVDSSNHPGLYEFQIADARFAVASSRKMVITVSGAADLQQADYEIQLTRNDPYLNKFGAITGTGTNTLLGYIQAICRNDSTLPTDIGGTYDNTTESLQAFDLTAFTPTDIEDTVWDAVIADHLDAGTTGLKLNSAAAGGDPWSTAVPAAYGAGTAGYLVGTNLNATISSRLAPTTPGFTLDVTATGEAGLDWSNINAPTTTVNLSGTTIKTATDVATSTASILTKLPAALVSGRMDSSVGAYQSGLQPLLPTVAGRTLDVSATGEAGVDWANVGSPTTTVGLSGTTIKAVTDAGTLTAGERNSIADATLARTLGTESYGTDGSVPTLAQAMFMLMSKEFEMSIVGTTMTCKKLDGSTTSMTFTLNSATTPTSITRAT